MSPPRRFAVLSDGNRVFLLCSRLQEFLFARPRLQLKAIVRLNAPVHPTGGLFKIHAAVQRDKLHRVSNIPLKSKRVG